MNNLGSEYGPFFPLAGQINAKPSATHQAVPEQKYILPGLPLHGMPLNQRSVMPYQASPTYYQNHSCNVGSLLQQRSYLEYQLQKLSAFIACMEGGAAMINQLSTLQQSLQFHNPMPMIPEGNLLYRQPTGDITSFRAYAGTIAPSSLQSTPSYLQEMIADPLFQAWQPFTHDYQHTLHHQLQQNNKELSFQGYPPPALSPFQSMVYPFNVLQQWLTTPLSQPVVPLQGYFANQPNDWPSSYPLLFSSTKQTSLQPVTNSTINNHQALRNDPLSAAFEQRFNMFHYPVTPKNDEQEYFSQAATAISDIADVSETMNEKPVQQWMLRPAKKINRSRAAVLSDAANNRLASSTQIKRSPLGRCINLLENQDATSHREVLTTLFNSWEGQVLFGGRDHMQGQPLSKTGEDIPDHYNSENIPVDISSTLKFIDLYARTIKLERKPGKAWLEKHHKKNSERMNALSQIRQFVAELNDQDPDCAALCRLALQMCGRVRERRLVSQKQIPLCGGFALMQNAWGTKPLMMTKVLLDLARNECCYVRTMTSGKEKRLTIPPLNFTRFSEALADKLLLATLYDLNRDNSSTPGRDAVNALFLGISAKPFNQSRWGGASSADANQPFLQAMTQASNQQCAVRGALTGKLWACIHNNLLQGLERKANKDAPLDMEQLLSQVKESRSGSHAVVFDAFKVIDDHVVFKLYTWGRVYHLKMKTDTFLENIDKYSFVLFNQKGTDTNNSIFKAPEIEVLDKKSDTLGIILSVSGEEIPVVKGQTVTGFGTKKYTYKGNGSWGVHYT
ncbi:MAG: hypothetical protein PUP46_01525 [Endozoicomonas sp. (ex Botrylloides leachii)]|nr:hypothetical protein [Endozoicomonas sp. (ex Botrylloides leachii)]